jgi:hypothetical protein
MSDFLILKNQSIFENGLSWRDYFNCYRNTASRLGRVICEFGNRSELKKPNQAEILTNLSQVVITFEKAFLQTGNIEACLSNRLAQTC